MRSVLDRLVTQAARSARVVGGGRPVPEHNPASDVPRKVGWRIQNSLQLPKHWSYSDPHEIYYDEDAEENVLSDNRSSGFQIWTSPHALLAALFGQDRDGKYRGLYVLSIAYSDSYEGVGEWEAVRPGKVLAVRAAFASDIRREIENRALSTRAETIERWALRRPRLLTEMLWRRSLPVPVRFRETLPLPAHARGYRRET
jgi:hypothetical protein